MMASWKLNATIKSNAIKSSAGIASYILHDSKPVVCLRARFRLGVALTPQRRFIYSQVSSSLCPRCGVVGTTKHIILHCIHFGEVRARCAVSLAGLYFPVVLTLDLVLGEPPSTPAAYVGERKFLKSIHEQCLRITGEFLLDINKKMPI